MNKSAQPVLLYTPGIDSLLAKWWLKKTHDINPQLIYYALRTRYTEQECLTLTESGEIFEIDTTFCFNTIEDRDAHVPHRNIHMALHATGLYGNIVYVNGTLSDRVSDNNPKIFKKLSELASMSLGYDVEVKQPFPNNLYKNELAQQYVEDGNDPMGLAHTFSCYFPNREKRDLHYHLNGTKVSISTWECLRCKACFRKGVILNSVGIYRAFNQSRITNKYLEEFKDETDPRSLATLDYITSIKNGVKKKS
jgi:7-cyano-7-deazaguanine synthase in queuosine biosynthesis